MGESILRGICHRVELEICVSFFTSKRKGVNILLRTGWTVVYFASGNTCCMTGDVGGWLQKSFLFFLTGDALLYQHGDMRLVRGIELFGDADQVLAECSLVGIVV
jgi:hypothetical protein